MGSCCPDLQLSVTRILFVQFFCLTFSFSSFWLQQRSSTRMWRSKYKMWRAQPLLSGATCPAGSKISCCESCFRALFSLSLLSHALLCCSSLVWFSTFVFFPSFLLPHSVFTLYPNIGSSLYLPLQHLLYLPFQWLSLDAFPPGIHFFCLGSLPAPFLSFPCHSFLIWRFDPHQLSPPLPLVSFATISPSPSASSRDCRGIISNILQESIYLTK